MTLLLTVLALRNSQIHIGSSYSYDIITYVEIFANKSFNFCTILGVPDIDLIIATCHIQAHPFRNYISTVISSPNYTSLPFIVATCYKLKSLVSDNRTILVLSNIRELNRDFFTN